jgi:penicillin-binding protein 1C
VLGVIRRFHVSRRVLAGVALTLGLLACGSLAGEAPAFAEVRAGWRPSEAWLLDRHGTELSRLRLDYSVRRLEWVPLARVPAVVVDTVARAEDRRFWTHAGVDWRALGAAALAALTGGGARGASTITMQVAALLDPALGPRRGGRTLGQKADQVRAALALDRAWRKHEVIEAYLNLAPFRGEHQGIGAAAQVLLGKAPDALDAADAHLLAALLPAPNAAPERVADRACRLAREGAGAVPCEWLRALAHRALAGPGVPAASPGLAPHLARVLLAAPGARVTSTLDGTLQGRVREVLAAQIRELEGGNVRDGAALVVDNASGEVLAYVGSAGEGSAARHVDGVRARRQAGSTLKPFLYALALERGYLTAASLLDDSPVQLETGAGLYVPQNYDRDFRGLVSVRTALAASLNVPAVRALILTGLEAFRDRLVTLGYGGVTEEGEFYGYALALGAPEVSLLEQVNAYRTLANGGVSSPLRFLAQGPTGEAAAGPGGDAPRRVLPAAAAFVIADVLSDPAGRAATFGLASPLGTGYWSAVKTGTSKDLRDNWCVGFSDRYTVGVWVGNFEGDSMRGVSGVAGAAPAWRAIMDLLHPDRASRGPGPPPGLVARRVEFEGGLEPARTEWFLAGTEVGRVERAGADGPARITSPPDGVTIALDPDIPPDRQVVPLEARGAGAGLLWVLDGVALGPATRPHRWQPTRGEHVVRLVTPDGAVRYEARFQVR